MTQFVTGLLGSDSVKVRRRNTEQKNPRSEAMFGVGGGASTSAVFGPTTRRQVGAEGAAEEVAEEVARKEVAMQLAPARTCQEWSMLMNEDFASCLPCFIISLYLYLPFASLLSTHAACAHRLRAHWLH